MPDTDFNENTTKKKGPKINPDELDGLVWILDGTVHVKKELPGGMPPLINPANGVKLIVNGEECNHLVSLKETDNIKLETKVFERPQELSVEVTDNNTKAFLNYSPPRKVKRVIVDAYPVNKLDVKFEEAVIEATKITKETLLAFIREEGINTGIDDKKLDEICATNVQGKYLVASGKEAVEPVDEEVEFFFDADTEIEINLEQDDSGDIDYRNATNYLAVKPGQMIAKIKPGKEGENGVSVFGDEVVVRKPKIITVLQNTSIFYEEEENIIRATKSGRPTHTMKDGNLIITIYDKLDLNEVNMKTGNVKFKGDVEISGSVNETMEVVAKENVSVKENVSFATVFAGNNVTVKQGGISSKINAGIVITAFRDPSPEISRVKDEIGSLIDNLSMFSNADMQKHGVETFPEVMRYMMNNDNKNLPTIIYEVIRNLKRGNYDIDEELFVEFINKITVFLGSCDEIKDINYITKLKTEMDSLFTVKKETKVTGHVNINYLLNSEVSALGNIIISGRGSFNSKLFSRGRIVINGHVRGGELRAEKSIEANKVGTQNGGVNTFLSVSEKGWIRVKFAYPDTVIKVGNLSKRFLSEQKMINARIENRKLVF
jgi:uncharacterized protein (DUF342 family)